MDKLFLLNYRNKIQMEVVHMNIHLRIIYIHFHILHIDNLLLLLYNVKHL